MGTNYYAVKPSSFRDEDYVYERIFHVGKSGTMLRCYPGDTWDDDPTGTGFGPIKGWQDWKKFLAETPDLVFLNEYGVRFSLADFLAVFESTSPEQRRRQYDAAHGHPYGSTRREWLDTDGFSCSDTEFS